MGKLDSQGDRDEGPGPYLAVLLFLLLGFSALTYLATSSGSPADVGGRPRLLTTLATITGPFTGVIARREQSCCLANSQALALWLAPALALGIAAPVALPGHGAMARAARMSLWTVGWIAWLMGGPISFLHALN